MIDEVLAYIQPCVTMAMNEELFTDISVKVVQLALFHMATLKTLGPNILPALFYQRLRVPKKFTKVGIVPRGRLGIASLNRRHIDLILKVAHPELCISTVTYSMFVNEVPRNMIVPTRGLRQGDWFNMLLQQIDKDDIEEICCVMWALWKSRNSIMVKNERMNLIQVVQLEYDMYTWYKVAIFVERSNQLTTGSKGNWWSCLARTKLNYDLAIFELNGERWVGSSFIIKNSNGKLVRRLCLIQMLCWLS
ncbi:Uncharacterized protein TCM_027433 [Theobroma cacao]|uniref:Reverse transcriptase domain-containing protein n=1 Tax=Theobroma cacao TaxID=3641 RepID=A0A061G914_THECC|nr:Uncharacterized protein TCM_027433 [Theobroma cacao]